MKKNKFTNPYLEILNSNEEILTVSINADPDNIWGDKVDDDYDWEG